MEPIPPKALPSEIRNALESANIRAMPITRTNRAMCAASQGIQRASAIDSTCSRPKTRKYQASHERLKSMGVQIGAKRAANFAHLSDLDYHARVEGEQALPAGEILSMSVTCWRCLKRPSTAKILTRVKSPRLWRE
eukprot:6208177-Pleurochrysis_carterae.AAC.1